MSASRLRALSTSTGVSLFIPVARTARQSGRCVEIGQSQIEHDAIEGLRSGQLGAFAGQGYEHALAFEQSHRNITQPPHARNARES
jgi:hypothetical protein